MSGLLQRFQRELRPQLAKELGFDNIAQVPRPEKMTLNMGVGEGMRNRAELTDAAEQLALIACQKPVLCPARGSVASFKIRTGMLVGCKVTLRRQRMFDFMERLVSISLPRERDFQGFRPSSMDGTGNFSLGIREHIIFPEIDYDKVGKLRGLDISITTSAANDKEGLALLKVLGFPFRS